MKTVVLPLPTVVSSVALGWLAMALAWGSLEAAVTIDPNSLGETDVSLEVGGQQVFLQNPLADPFIQTTLVRIGITGRGTIAVTAGSDASATQWWLGFDPSSHGVLSIDGAGSTLGATSEIRVGLQGTARLSVLNDADVTTAQIYAGDSLIEVRGAGSTLTSTEQMLLGTKGSAQFNTTDGGKVSANDILLGYFDGTSAVAVVSGAASKWELSDDLEIGVYSKGSLTITSGGVVEAAGQVLLDNRATSGHTSLILDGGVLNAGTLYADADDFSGTGIINTSGLVADFPVVFDATHPVQQTMLFPNGAGQNVTLNLTAMSPRTLGAGYKGNGSLEIAGGRQVTTDSGVLGHGNGSVGTAALSGAGTKWTINSQLTIGSGGTGQVTVGPGASVVADTIAIGESSTSTNSYLQLAGGTVTTETLLASPQQLRGQGIIQVNSNSQTGGFFTDTSLVLETPGAAPNTLRFNSEPGQDVTVDFSNASTGHLGVGYKAAGSLLVRNGAQLTLGALSLGRQTGSEGTAVITGASTQLTVGSLRLADREFGQSRASFKVLDGATVSASQITLTNPSSIEVGGANSKLLGGGQSSSLSLTYNYSPNPTIAPSTGPLLRIHSGGAAIFDQLSIAGPGTSTPPAWIVVEGASSTLQIQRSSSFNRTRFEVAAGATLTLGKITAQSTQLANLTLQNGSTLYLRGGMVDCQRGSLTLNQSTLLFESGTLRNFTFYSGDVNQLGGSLALHFGTAFELPRIAGNYFQASDAKLSLQMRPSPQLSPLLEVFNGSAILQGELELLLPASQTPNLALTYPLITLLRANNGILGAFSNYKLPALPAQWDWELQQTNSTIAVRIFTGDYNNDGVVDAGDYSVWRDTRNSTTLLAADGNRDGRVDYQDYDLWRTNFGKRALNYTPSSSAAVAATVPEPRAIAGALLLLQLLRLRQRRNHNPAAPITTSSTAAGSGTATGSP